MFTINNVTLRPLELDDIDTLYGWESDTELSILTGWVPVLSRAAFRQKYERRITEPEQDRRTFTIVYEERMVGFIELVLIENYERRAAISILIGVKDLWGRGIGSTAMRILLDFAFSVRGLERVYTEVYGLNERSQRLMERVGFQREGILRQHDLHNGTRQDLHVFGILKAEFYAKYETLFKLPS